MFNSWVGQVDNVSADGTALTASTTETSIINALHKYTLPPQDGDFVGKKYRLTAGGRISNIVTTPGTLTLRLKFGAVAVWTSAAIQLSATAQTNVPWFLEVLLELRTVGSGTSATLFGLGQFTSLSGVTAAIAVPYNTAPVVGAGFDSTAQQAIDFTGQFSLNNANSIQVHLFSFEKMN